MTAPRVLLCDDHPMVCEGLRLVLEPTYHVVGMVYDGKSVLEAVRRLEPDLILLDISLPGASGLEVARELAREHIPARIAMLTMHAEPTFADEALRAGAHGYLLKNSTGHDLLAALDEIMQGRTFVDPLLARVRLARPAAAPALDGGPSISLGERQRDVLALIARGMSNAEVAERLGVTLKAVEYHKTRIKRALGVSSTAAMVRYAVDHGLIAPPEGSGGAGSPDRS